MTRRVIAMMIALVLCTGCIGAGSCEGGSVERWYVPEEFARIFNMSLDFLLASWNTDDKVAKSRVRDAFLLHYTETDGDTIVYNNDTWNLELIGVYEDTIPDANAPAAGISFRVDADFKGISLVKMIVGTTIYVLDDTLDPEELMEFMDSSWITGNRTLFHNDYLLMSTYQNERWYIEFLPIAS